MSEVREQLKYKFVMSRWTFGKLEKLYNSNLNYMLYFFEIARNIKNQDKRELEEINRELARKSLEFGTNRYVQIYETGKSARKYRIKVLLNN